VAKYLGTILAKQIAIIKKIKAHWTWDMPTTIQVRILYLPTCYPKTKLNTDNYNFACCFIRMWNFVSHIEEKHRNRNTFWPKMGEVTGGCIMTNHVNSTPCQILLGWSNEKELDKQGIWHIWKAEKAHIGFWSRNLKAWDHVEDQAADCRLIAKWIQQYDWIGETCGELIWLKTGTSGGLMWAR
jgi:hypothetical protein